MNNATETAMLNDEMERVAIKDALRESALGYGDKLETPAAIDVIRDHENNLMDVYAQRQGDNYRVGFKTSTGYNWLTTVGRSELTKAASHEN